MTTLEARGYEEICRRHVAARADRGELPFGVLDVGRMWDGRAEIDVAGIDRRSGVALIGECRWRRGRRMDIEVLDELRAKAAAMRPLRGLTLHCALFSRGGFSTALERRARREGVLLVEGVPGVTNRRAS